ncbi:MAG TPA: hypothetical protein VET46_01240 [Steroidobacteraceae bacterium]|nr:hypothetical protein [Steroidobacteraceae bacterium]
MTKILVSAAISAVLAGPVAAVADDAAMTWPDKAKPSAQSEQRKARTTPRADEAMSGSDGAAARGSTRPNYDPPMRPNDARPIPPFRTDSSAASGGTAAKRKGE